MIRKIILLSIILVIFVSNVSAGSISNGGFESVGTIHPWAEPAGQVSGCGGFPGTYVYEGVYGLKFQIGTTSPKTIYLNHSTVGNVVASEYISFWAKRPLSTSYGITEVSIYSGNTLLTTIPIAQSTNWTNYKYDFTENHNNIRIVIKGITTEYSGTHYVYQAFDSFVCGSYPAPMVYNFKDQCGNMLENNLLDVSISNTVSGWVYGYNVNPLSFSNNYFNETDSLLISSLTHYSGMSWDRYPSHGGSEDIEVSINWNLAVTVRNASNNAIIPNAKLDMLFGCRCAGASATEIKYTGSDGKATFISLANQAIAYNLSAVGYTDSLGDISAEFSPQIADYGVTLYLTPKPQDDPEDPEDPEDPTPADPMSVYFSDTDNNIKTQFNNDVITNFKLWYRNTNVSGTLTFEYLNDTSYETLLSWDVIPNEYDYKTISVTTISNKGTYKGKLSGASGSAEQIITVIDNTGYYNITFNTYDNVTMQALNSVYVFIDETMLFTDTDNIVTFYDMEEFINYSYYATKTGYQQTTTMYITLNGCDVSINIYLNPDEGEYTFTIDVYDDSYNPLTYATVYLNGYGTLSTGSANYATFTGLVAGDYQYMASKSGYYNVNWSNTSIITSDISESVYLTPMGFISDIIIKNDGRAHKVNESTDHEIDIYIDGIYTSDYNVTVEFVKGSVYISDITLTYADFTNNHYIWYPSVSDYENGYYYYAELYDNNEGLMGTDYVLCDAITEYNFTVYVFGEGSTPLTHSTVYLEGIGMCDTGSLHYCTFYDLPVSLYVYYAAKDGYVQSDSKDVYIENQDLSTNIYLIESEMYTVQINVYNETNIPLTNSVVYLSGDAINTGGNNYGIFDNIAVGTYTGKASKSGYITSDLIDIVVLTTDKSIDIILIESTDTPDYEGDNKLSDKDAKEFYLMFIWLLLFVLIFGAFMMLINGDY